MLTRQKTILALLLRAEKPLTPTVFVKMVFLLRHETILRDDRTFYDFVPYKYGPFSFALYRELANLRRDGYVTPDEERIAISEQSIGLAKEKIDELPAAFREAVDNIVKRYGGKSQTGLIKDVYSRYPWYAIKSELTELRPKPCLTSCNAQAGVRAKRGYPVIYTVGYEGKSVDAFFNHLLKNGIRLLIDVRANPVSRRYGFSKRRLGEIAGRLGLDYRHMPALGIASSYRTDLTDFASYQRLLQRYEHEMLPHLQREVAQVGKLMKSEPSVLMCVEKDVMCCHRSRLAEAVSRETGMEIVHI